MPRKRLPDRHDPQRIDFLKRYIREYARAAEDGIPLVGYIHWSFMDNFEWAEGYDPIPGLIVPGEYSLRQSSLSTWNNGVYRAVFSDVCSSDQGARY